MRNARRTVVLGVLLVPVLVMAADGSRTAGKTGWWPEVLERTFRDALSFSREMMARIHHANLNAVEVGQLAERRASSPELRRYGRLLAADRQLQDAQLVDYAAHRMGVTIGPPELVMEAERELVQQRAAQVARLQTLAGPAFDRELLALLVRDNESSLELVDQSRVQLDDPALRIMLDQTLPVLQQHERIGQVLRGRATVSPEGR